MRSLGDIFLLTVLSPETLDILINNTKQPLNRTINPETVISRKKGLLVTNNLYSILFNVTVGSIIAFIGGTIMRKKKETF